MLTGSIHEAPLREMFAHWRACSREGRCVPDRERMDMLDLPVSVLPHTFIYEREETGRFRCRLAGTRFAEELGYEPTGQYIDTRLDSRPGRRRIELFAECLEAPRALYYRARMGVIGYDHRESGRLLLPVTDPDGNVRFVFGGMMVARVATAVSARADDSGMIELHRGPPIDIGTRRSVG